jgi:hypothetical protein
VQSVVENLDSRENQTYNSTVNCPYYQGGYQGLQIKTKQKHNTISIGHQCAQTNTRNIKTTCALLQTTGGRDKSNIIFMLKS